MLGCLGLALNGLPRALQSAELELLTRSRIVGTSPDIGGFSGVAVMNGGAHLLLLSDRGRFFTANVMRTEGNLAPEVDSLEFFGLIVGDVEGLAVGPDNQIFVSTESPAQVHQAWNTCLPSHDDFAEMPRTKSLEALASASNGTLYTIRERIGAFNEPLPVYRLVSGRWEVFSHLDMDFGFAVVGAAIDHDDDLYILERRLGILGFKSRIRRMNLETGEVLELWASRFGEFDNLEGIDVWQNQGGETRITLVSDNNFRRFARSEIVELVLRR